MTRTRPERPDPQKGSASRVLVDVLTQMILRLALGLYYRTGVRLPFLFRRASERASPETLSSYEREALIREIKGQRYALRMGPLWFRASVETSRALFKRNRFWLSALLKVLAGVVFVAVPLLAFVVTRLVLPVPERLPNHFPRIPLPAETTLRTDWPYTEGPFLSSAAVAEPVLTTDSRRVASVRPADEARAPAGLTEVALRTVSGDVERLRGYLVTNRTPRTVERQRDIRISIAGRNRLRLRIVPLPTFVTGDGRTTSSGAMAPCRIDVFDGESRLLMRHETASIEEPPASLGASRILDRFRARLFGGTLVTREPGPEFFVNLDRPPRTLRLVTRALGDETDVSAGDPTSPGAPRNSSPGSVTAAPSASVQCAFLVADIAFEWQAVAPAQSRGLVLVSVDGLDLPSSLDPELMPNLVAYEREKAITFTSHIDQEGPVETAAGFHELLRGRFSFESTGPSTSGLCLPALLRESGTRTMFIGEGTPSVEHSRDLGATGGLPAGRPPAGRPPAGRPPAGNSAEASLPVDCYREAALLAPNSYTGRTTVESATEWLETYGEVPFFLHLHFNPFDTHKLPAFADIEVADFLRAPVLQSFRNQMREARARAFDRELGLLLRKLNALGLLDQLTIAIVGRGAQGLRVPWILDLPDEASLRKERIEGMTGQTDVPEVLAGLVGGKLRGRGLDFSQALMATGADKATIEATLAHRRLWFPGKGAGSGVVVSEGHGARYAYELRRSAGTEQDPRNSDPKPLPPPFSQQFVQQFAQPIEAEEVISEFIARRRFELDPSLLPPGLLARLREDFLRATPLATDLALQALVQGPRTIVLGFQARTTSATADGDTRLGPGLVTKPPRIAFLVHADPIRKDQLVATLTGPFRPGDVIIVSPGDYRLSSVTLSPDAQLTGCAEGFLFSARDLAAFWSEEKWCLHTLPAKKPTEAAFAIAKTPFYEPAGQK